jgi:hypothetical protein
MGLRDRKEQEVRRNFNGVEVCVLYSSPNTIRAIK